MRKLSVFCTVCLWFLLMGAASPAYAECDAEREAFVSDYRLLSPANHADQIAIYKKNDSETLARCGSSEKSSMVATMQEFYARELPHQYAYEHCMKIACQNAKPVSRKAMDAPLQSTKNSKGKVNDHPQRDAMRCLRYVIVPKAVAVTNDCTAAVKVQFCSLQPGSFTRCQASGIQSDSRSGAYFEQRGFDLRPRETSLIDSGQAPDHFFVAACYKPYNSHIVGFMNLNRRQMEPFSPRVTRDSLAVRQCTSFDNGETMPNNGQ